MGRLRCISFISTNVAFFTSHLHRLRRHLLLLYPFSYLKHSPMRQPTSLAGLEQRAAKYLVWALLWPPVEAHWVSPIVAYRSF